MCLTTRPVVVLLVSLFTLAASAAPPGASKNLGRATDLGATAPSKIVPITVWLRLHDGAGLEQAVQQQHDPGSSRFQLWASDAALDAAHAPTAAEAATVSTWLRASGLTVTGVGAHNLSVSARGTAAQVQSAFKVQLRDFSLGSQRFHANTSAPALPSHVEPLVAFVGGLRERRAQPMNRRATEPSGQTSSVPLASHPDGILFSPQCFRPPQQVHFASADATATYFGNRFGADLFNTTPGTLPACGYQPSELQSAYDLKGLYRAGLDGTGRTVAIVDAFGSTTLQQDLAAFSSAMKLPPANLTVIGTPTASPFSADPDLANWAFETTLDVEWVHAIAPGAKIVLVVSPDNSDDNLFQGILTAAAVPGVTAISNSWSDIELNTSPESRAATDAVLQAVAAKGISVHFASGDAGDESINLGVANANYPGSSPYATSIGGVSLSLKPNLQIDFQTAWGMNRTAIADSIPRGSPPFDPVFNLGFLQGSGGGLSDVYPKPSFQHSLAFARRATPDISWLADPYTGVEIIFTGDDAGEQFITLAGGTSLSCPMFSALWAIAAQRAGKNLGQAARSIYELGGGAITDVTVVGSRTNVSGLILDAGGRSPEVASDLAAPLQNLPDFYSALLNGADSLWYVLTFGTDSTLAAAPGFDLATGLGTPNPPQFVEALARRR